MRNTSKTKQKAVKKVVKKPISKKTAKQKVARKKESKLPVSYEDVCRAAKRLDGVANKTPVMTSRTLNAKTGAKFYLKCENF